MKKQPDNAVLKELIFIPCLICHKQIKEGYYARWEGGGTCSKKCEQEKEKIPRYPPSTLKE